MINLLIVEDEQPAARRLQKMLLELDPEINIVGVADTVDTAVNWLSTKPQPDLIMLDIQLGDGLSFSIFNRVKVSSYVIFTTAYDEYAIRAFDLNSIGYLLKPVEKEKLNSALQKFRSMGNARQDLDIRQIIQAIDERKEQHKKRFVVNVASRIRIIDTGSIAYFYSMEKGTYICTSDNKHYPLEYSLDSIEDMVDSASFFRVNRAFLVSLKAISRIDVVSKSRIKLTTDPPFTGEVLVSGPKSSDFRTWIDK
jgi:DNA-binding LytR/AlgR family response regulator